jgi:DNA end-binding protein Ku
MSGKEQMVALRPKDRAFVMSTLFYNDEIRSLSAIEELQSTPEVNPQELTLATQLIDAITQPFEPGEFKDGYREAITDVIKAKVEGREVVEPPQVETGKVINLMDALKNSLEQAQEPAASDGKEAPSEEGLTATGTESG